jgi:hypothetical protein
VKRILSTIREKQFVPVDDEDVDDEDRDDEDKEPSTPKELPGKAEPDSRSSTPCEAQIGSLGSFRTLNAF